MVKGTDPTVDAGKPDPVADGFAAIARGMEALATAVAALVDMHVDLAAHNLALRKDVSRIGTALSAQSDVVREKLAEQKARQAQIHELARELSDAAAGSARR